MKARGGYLGELLGKIKENAGKSTPRLIVIGVLILISIVYWYYGFQNSFIPYSTAWDANHEYMYTPKMLAENNGVMRGNTVISTMPGMWHMLITFFFSLTGLTGGRLGLSSDTIAVSMNFLSGALTLLLGIGLVYQVSALFRKKEEGA
ncbi:MAG: hypothetical protein LBG52_01020 [Candidatus Peribacteria bacterium]|nr:hypothetical protein [Candidatus Peribacteria bacterium]